MKRCKICHIEAELTDGRCHSCQMAKEATDHHMTYGKYVAMINQKRNEPLVVVKTPDIYTSKCVWCGKEFPKFGARRYCSDLCRQERNYYEDRKRKGKDMSEIQPQKCLACGKEFVPSRRGVKYCSRVCSTSRRAAYVRWEAKKNDRSRVD